MAHDEIEVSMTCTNISFHRTLYRTSVLHDAALFLQKEVHDMQTYCSDKYDLVYKIGLHSILLYVHWSFICRLIHWLKNISLWHLQRRTKELFYNLIGLNNLWKADCLPSNWMADVCYSEALIIQMGIYRIHIYFYNYY